MYRPPGIKLGRKNTAIMKPLKYASAVKFDGVIIWGNFKHPTISWTEQESVLRGEQNKCCQASAKFIDEVGNLNLYQKIREPTFTSKREKERTYRTGVSPFCIIENKVLL
jgi:hypothetical protein